MGDVFLRLFLKEVGFADHFSNWDDLTVHREHWVGSIRDGKTRGGLVDIVIRDGTNSVCIENKIDAADQSHQLVRYQNAYEAGKTYVLYLTLDGHDASPGSKGHLALGRDYSCISYEGHIMRWLDACLAEVRSCTVEPVDDISPLATSIEQYRRSVESITTNRNIMDRMDELELLLDKWKEAQQVTELVTKTLPDAQLAFKNALLEELGRQGGLLSSSDELCAFHVNRGNHKQLYIKAKGDPECKFILKNLGGGKKASVYAAIMSRRSKNEIQKREVIQFEEREFSLWDIRTLEKIADPRSESFREVRDHVVKEFLSYMERMMKDGKLRARLVDRNAE